jgi:uncharacterized protein (TIGR04255 family)
LSERTYKHPSILEAVFELRFQSLPSWGISSFVEFARLAKESGYPVLKDAAESFQLTFPIGGGGTPAMSKVPSRVQTWNEEGTQLWQAGPEMFAANRRAPYRGWSNFRPHIVQGLELYRKVANPEQAEVLKMQYVNRIEVDAGQNSPSDFVSLVPPEIEYADQVSNFVCRTDQSFSDGDQIAVASTRDLSVTSGLAIILDILYTATKPSLEQNALMDTIEKAHSRVISAFEKSITDALRERMELVC